MRKKLLAGNWKMNKDIAESIDLISEINKGLNSSVFNKADVIVCPPFISIYPVCEYLKHSEIKVGGQNMYKETEGAYTGEISANMLISAGCRYVILGHSERRQYFGENDTLINQKMEKAITSNLIPILCVGETLSQREENKHIQTVTEQVKSCLKNIEASNEQEKFIIAYEPVWAIGTGVNATPEQAEEMHSEIRGILKELYGEDISEQIRILYGGSINEINSTDLFKMKNIDGGLVGGASIKAESFIKIINSVQ